MHLDVSFLLFSRDSIITQYECICRKLSYSGKDLFFRQIVCIVILILYICSGSFPQEFGPLPTDWIYFNSADRKLNLTTRKRARVANYEHSISHLQDKK